MYVLATIISYKILTMSRTVEMLKQNENFKIVAQIRSSLEGLEKSDKSREAATISLKMSFSDRKNSIRPNESLG